MKTKNFSISVLAYWLSSMFAGFMLVMTIQRLDYLIAPILYDSATGVYFPTIFSLPWGIYVVAIIALFSLSVWFWSKSKGAFIAGHHGPGDYLLLLSLILNLFSGVVTFVLMQSLSVMNYGDFYENPVYNLSVNVYVVA